MTNAERELLLTTARILAAQIQSKIKPMQGGETAFDKEDLHDMVAALAPFGPNPGVTNECSG